MDSGIYDVLAMEKCGFMGKNYARIAETNASEERTQTGANVANNGQSIGKDGTKRGQRGYDAGKKVKGRKRHIAVDTMGNILSVVVHSAGISESRGAHLVLIRLFVILPVYSTSLLMGDTNQVLSTGLQPCLAISLR
jgi:hypothetical protein